MEAGHEQQSRHAIARRHLVRGNIPTAGIDFNTASRRHHFSPEELKLCRRLEREFEPESTEPKPRGIDFNGARPLSDFSPEDL
jgi:hypothetical protein